MTSVIVSQSSLNPGKIDIHGHKHVVVPIIMASVLSGSKVTLTNVPDIMDVQVLVKIIRLLNGEAHYQDNTLVINAENLEYKEVPPDLTGLVHGSIYLLPTLACKFGKVKLGKSGGCQIGDQAQARERPVWHILEILQHFGAVTKESSGHLEVEISQVKPCLIDIMRFSESSESLTGPLGSGASKTAVLAAMAVPHGTTIIKNCYSKSDVTELLDFIKLLGYDVIAEDGTVKISKKNPLKKQITFKIMSDISELVTYVTCGIYNRIPMELTNITVEKVKEGLQADLALMEQMGITFHWGKDSLKVPVPAQIYSTNVEITPLGVHTDHQPFYCLLLLMGDKASWIREYVWKHRFSCYVDELKKLGARIEIDGNCLTVTPGIPGNIGQTLTANDLRSAAMLITAALRVKGLTRIDGIQHLDRGYEGFIENLKSLGGEIDIVN